MSVGYKVRELGLGHILEYGIASHVCKIGICAEKPPKLMVQPAV